MAGLSKTFLSLVKQVFASLIPSESESAWDDYRSARSLATQPIRIK